MACQKKITFTQKIYNALEKPRNRYFAVVNNFLGVVTALSVLAVILETVPSLNSWQKLFLFTEYLTVGIFLIEYLIRLSYSPSTVKYFFSFFGLIDLIAIIPTFLGLTSLTFLKSARTVRTMRSLRALRLIKMSRYADKKQGSQAVLGFNFKIYLTLIITAVVILGTLLYTFEQAGGAPNIPQGMYWAFLAIIGGQNYPTATTTGGEIIMILVRFSALIFFGLVIGIVGAMLRQTLTGSAKDVE